MMRSRLPVLLLALCALLWSSQAIAAPPERPDFEAGLLLGTTLDVERWDLGSTADSLDSPTLFSPQLGLRGTWWVIDYIGLTAEVSYLPHTSELSSGINHAMSWRAGGLITPFPSWKAEPFISGGYGIYHNIAGSRGADVDQRSDYGLGVRFVPGEAEHIILQFDARHVFTDGPEEFGLNNNVELLFGVHRTFGSKPKNGPKPPSDRDSDGIPDTADACPDTPGLAEFDGCPDTDADGIPDVRDRCPEDPGLEQFEGCPDSDNDGIPDPDDQCPNEPEDIDGVEDADGCPDPDNDGDKILDVDDKCPDDAETYNGFEDEDGCPEVDSDGDGLVDGMDKCPDEPETYNGKDDEDGCPDGEETVVVSETEVKILQSIYFEFGKAIIKEESYELLDTVATVLRQNPQITKIRIEGHTDDVDTEAVNMELSRERANAVREYLKSKDIVEERLLSQGYGESQPKCKEMPELLENKRKNKKAIKTCRATNRRVQFKILEVNGEAIEATSSVEEAKEAAEETP